MSFPNYKYGTGLRNVGSYQVSGHPYVTGSTVSNGAEHKVSFPYVSKTVTVIASGSTGDPHIRVAFREAAAPGGFVIDRKHYITLDSNGDSITFDVKCTDLYISALNTTSGFELYASLTNIATSNMYELTGSGITD